MVCGNCGTSIADKAIVCYRCGTPTSAPASPVRPGASSGLRAILAGFLVLAALALGWFGSAVVAGPEMTRLMMVRGIASLVLAVGLIFLARAPVPATKAMTVAARASSRTITFALIWLVIAVAVWNGFFDLYVSRGAREYLQLQAEFELGRGPAPAMAEVMARASRDGVWGASLWAAVVLAAGMGDSCVAKDRGLTPFFPHPCRP